MRSYDFVQKFKESRGLASDYKASEVLGITRQAMSNYKNGRPLDEDLALKIAPELGISESEILYVIAAEKSKTIESKKAWLRLSKLRKEVGAASPNLLILLGFCTAAMHKFYILCQIRQDSRLLVRNVIVHTGT